MSDSGVLSAVFYHISPLENEIRGEFELPVWPYYNGPYEEPCDEIVDYFQSLNIIRYQDCLHSIALLIPLPSGDDPLMNGPINAYRSHVLLDEDDLTVLTWKKSDFSANLDIYYKELEKTGDSFAWQEFNCSCRILAMTRHDVKLARSTEGKKKNAKT